MDDVALRLGLVAIAVMGALAVAWYRQRLTRAPGRPVSKTDLAPGLYLFSARSCDTCGAARSLIQQRHGADYTEFVWEDHPDEFEAIGVVEVPAVLVVAANGSARLFAGQIASALGAR